MTLTGNQQLRAERPDARASSPHHEGYQSPDMGREGREQGGGEGIMRERPPKNQKRAKRNTAESSWVEGIESVDERIVGTAYFYRGH